MWENFVFLVIFGTCDVVYNWFIRFVLFRHNFGFLSEKKIPWISRKLIMNIKPNSCDFFSECLRLLDKRLNGHRIFVRCYIWGTLIELEFKSIDLFSNNYFCFIKKKLKFSNQKDHIFPEFSSLKFQFSKKLFMGINIDFLIDKLWINILLFYLYFCFVLVNSKISRMVYHQRSLESR